MPLDARELSLAECAELACVWEARAHKAGNVNPEHAFADLTVDDFYRSATAIGPIIGSAPERPVGVTVLRAIEATRQVATSNTNLGIVLLLAPLAAVPRSTSLIAGIEQILAGLTIEDSRQVFAAIRLAQPGGLAQAPSQDVRNEPTLPLRDVMALAADRDMVARQYVNGFRDVLIGGLDKLKLALQCSRDLETAIIGLQLSLLAHHRDSLIIRKLGLQVATTASMRAQLVLERGWPSRREEYARLDHWLRADGNARNPGTTADLVTASLFAALREGIIPIPCAIPWSHD